MAKAAQPVVLPRLAEEQRQINTESLAGQTTAEAQGGWSEPGEFVRDEHRRALAKIEDTVGNSVVREGKFREPGEMIISHVQLQ